jgi:hypothetical protein
MLNVHIPKDSFFTLYVKGKIEYKQTVDNLGTFIRFEGAVILFYKYPITAWPTSSGTARNYGTILP